MKKIIYLSFLLPLGFLFNLNLHSQQADIMMQGWYWDYPKTIEGANWADTLRLQTTELGTAGFTYLWLPPLSRTASGSWSNGYDPKDLFDYGEFGEGATGFGTRQDLDELVTALNSQNIKPVADLVYNHRDGGGVEDNPGLKNYITNFYNWQRAQDGANPFPYDRMRVVLPLGGGSGNGAGDYYFKFRSRSQHSKFHNWEYQIYMWTDKVGSQNLPAISESEPNGGGDCSEPNNTIGLRRHIQGQIDAIGCGIDEFKLTLTTDDFNATGDAIYIEFNRRSSGYSDLYIHGIWYAPPDPSPGQNIVDDLYYQTYTNYSWVPSGRGKMDWSYFKPNLDRDTYLAGDWDGMYFYYDYDQLQAKTRDSLFAWTRWNWSNVGIRGLRVDAIKHFSPQFMGDLLDNLYDNGMNPPMVVGEWYGTNTTELADWVNDVYDNMNEATKQAIAPRIFDFSLRESLRQACDQFGYDVRNVFGQSIVDQGKLNGLNVVTFTNNHDFRDHSGFASLIRNDVILSYAYILTNNQIGAPTVFYPDYFGYPAEGQPGYKDYHPAYKAPLKNQISKLMNIHNQYIYGANSRIYLNNFSGGKPNNLGGGNQNVLVYQLKGAARDVVVAINFSGSQVGFSQEIDGVSMGTQLEDLTGNAIHETPVVENANGINNSIWISVPGRSYAIYRPGSWGLWGAQRSFAGFSVKGISTPRTFWDNGVGNIQNYDFGTFTGSDVFELTSFDIKTWKKSGANVTGGNLYFSIYPKGQRPSSPVFSNQALLWLEDLGGISTGDQKWGFTGQAINLLDGLVSGEYTIEFYAEMNGADPHKSEFDSNQGNNFTAHFRYNYVRSNNDGNWDIDATWLDEIVPDNEAVSVEINHHVLLTTNKSVLDLTINGGSLTVSPTMQFSAVGIVSSALDESGLILQSDATGTASMIHHSPGIKATIQRHIAQANWGLEGDGWHMLATPVPGQSISGIWTPTGTLNDYDFYQWDEPTHTWLNQKVGGNNIDAFEPGIGYLAAYQQLSTKTFEGGINVNDVTIPLTRSSIPGATNHYGWNLLGNPFASALAWNHESWNRNENIGGVAKIWHNGAYIDIDDAQTIIPSANGFFVFTNQHLAEITIPAAARVHDDQNWYKEAGNRILLTAKAAGADILQHSVIKANPQATAGFDLQYDSRFMPGFAPMFYSVVDDENFSTNTLPQLTAQTAIPMGFVKNQADEFQVELAESIPDLEVYLTDLKLNVQHKFSDNQVYAFISEHGDEIQRFVLHFGTVGTNDIESSKNLLAWFAADQLYVNNFSERTIFNIFDVQGRLLKTETLAGEGLKQINLNLPSGIYIIILNDDQTSTSTKVVVY